jgi:putative peptidoglycan lipid II flippase
MKDTTTSILHSAKRFFSGTALSRVSGLLRDIAMAYAFGAHAAVAAFLVAFRFSHLLRRLLGEGALQSAFIPQFEKMRHQDPVKASLFFRNLSLSLGLFLSFLVIIVMGVLWGVLTLGNLQPDNQAIVKLTLLMMPSLIFICLFGINASLLQCEKKYFTPSVAPVAFNLLWIIGAFVLFGYAEETAMLYLTLFVNLACLAQWLVTIPATLKVLKNLDLNKAPYKLQLFSQDLLLLAAPLSLGIIGVGASQINNALDAVFARWASVEGPAYLWYAIRLQQLPLALFGIAISGALLPPLSRALKAGNTADFQRFLSYATEKSLMLMIPFTFALFFLGDSVINLIYGHGDFNQKAILGTTTCLWGYSFGLIPMALVLLLAPAFYAQEDYKTPTQASFISIIVNITLNFLMVYVFSLGAASVAIATSTSAWINLFLLQHKLNQATGVSLKNLKKSILKMTILSVFASLLVLVYNQFTLENPTLVDLWKNLQPNWPSAFSLQLKIFLMEGSLFLVPLIIGYYLLFFRQTRNLTHKEIVS